MKIILNKKISNIIFNILFAFIVCFFFVGKVSATTIVYVTGNSPYGAWFFNDPADAAGTGAINRMSDVVVLGQTFTLLGTAPAGNDCSTIWYKIKYNDKVGYICGEWASTYDLTTTYEDGFEATLATFPKSYWPYLISLHATYPNATFSAYKTNLKWSTAIYHETYDYTVTVSGSINRKSLIQYLTSLISRDAYKQYILNTETNNAGGGCSGGYCWYAASEKAVSIYMDPRNFLSPSYVFMFESNEYDSVSQTKAGVESIIANTFMNSSNPNYLTYSKNTLAVDASDVVYADALMDAAIESNISPYTLAARIIQEVGSSGSTIITGTVAGYEGYYNYYNIGAGGDDAIANGLTYAKNASWNTRVAAITGGANFIGANYNGTEYTQKWDVKGSDYTDYSDFFVSQYMQNVQAPSSQTLTIYQSYKANNNLAFPFKFIIPVYEDMPNEATTISEVITDSGYTYKEDYIGSVKVGSTVNTVLSNLKTSNNTIDVSIKSQDGVTSKTSDSRLATGDVLVISDGTNTENLRIIIYGDTNGDGEINASDYIKIKRNVMDIEYLSGYYKIAGDVNKNEGIDASDYVNIKNYIMGGVSLIN